MTALSTDLRERIVAGGKVAEVADRFGVSHDSVRRLQLKHERDESLAPGVRLGRTPRVGLEEEAALVALVQAHPSKTLEQMSELWQEQSGMVLPRSTMHDALRRVKARFKKNTRSS